jgi:porin
LNAKWRKSNLDGHLRLTIFAFCATSGLVSAQEGGRSVADANVTLAQTADNVQPIGNIGEVSGVAPPRRQSALRRFVTRIFGGETPSPDQVSPSGVPLATAPGTLDDLPPLPAAGPGENTDAGVDRPADAAGTATTDGGAGRGSQPVSSNPGAVDIIAGTGALGRALGLTADSGIRLGGVWVGDTSGVLAGGQNPGKWALNSLTILDLNFDLDKLAGWKGASIGTEYLNFTGQATNSLAGAFPGFDSLEAGPPFNRNELYELWFRQALFDNRLIFRIGKSVPSFDFNNVVKPVPVGDDPTASIPAVTSLIYTPIFVNPTMLGVMPGYYNSATGITVTAAPTKSSYVNYGFYDGNLAINHQTGLSGPRFDGYYFTICEIGAAYRVGAQRKPGNFGVGVWGQTGRLNTFNGSTTNGAVGTYLFGAQRLWFRRPGVDSSGVSGFYQFGANDNDAMRARDYVGGGLTAFGLVPGRPDDSFGFGIAWTALNQNPTAGNLFFPSGDHALRSNQLMLEWYYQMKLVNGIFFQTALTEIPNPGLSASFPSAFAITLRVIALF